jgi:hypothetical protein
MKLGKTTKRIIIAVFLIGLIGGSWAVWYVFFKPHRNVGAEKAAYSLTTKDLSAQIAADTAALSKYIDKALELEGTVTSVEDTRLAFDNVICNMDSTQLTKLSAIKPGQVVKVQGRLATYNDLLEEILVDQCVLK